MITLCLAVLIPLVFAVIFTNRAMSGSTSKALRITRRSLTVATAVAAMMAVGVFVAQRVGATPVVTNNFGSVAVGTLAGPMTITITGRPGTPVAGLNVTTQGSTGLDFANAGGGTCTAGFVFSTTTPTCTVQVNFTPRFPGQRDGSVIVFGTGVLLGSADITGTGASSQIAFKPGTIQTPLTTQRISGEVFDGKGNSYTTVAYLNQIFVTAPGGGPGVFAGNGTAGLVDGPEGSAEFNTPKGIAIDGAGNLYVSDTSNNVIREISGGQVTTIAGPGTVGTLGDGGPALSANLLGPGPIAVDASGNVYFYDSGNARIRRIDAATQIITTVAGNGTTGFAGDGGSGTAAAAEIGATNGIAIDAAGDLFFTDQTSNIIRELDAAGNLHTVAGTPGAAGNTGDGGLATLAKLNTPMGIVLDGSGSINFVDNGNFVVRRIDPAGNINTLVGVNGTARTPSTSPDGGVSTLPAFNSPTTLASDPSGNLFVANFLDTTIRSVTVGTVPTITIPDTTTGRASAKQSFTIYNTGNTALNFTALATTTDYSLLPSSTCAVGTPVAAGLSCHVDVVVTPSAVGVDNGSLTITSNSLNGTPSSVINFTTTANPAPDKIVITGGPASPISAGGSPGTVTVQEQTTGGLVVGTATDNITLTVTGPNSFNFTQTVTAVAGVATFDLSAQSLGTPGTYVYSASTMGATPPLASASVNEVVNAGPPSKIAVTVPATVVAGGNLGVITATIQDSLGNTVTTSSATVKAVVTGAGGYSAMFTSPAATNGVASVDLTGLAPLNTAGAYSVTFTSSDGATSGPQAFTVTIGAATKFIVSGVTTPITAGSNLGNITATVTDAGGNTVTTSTAAFTATITGPNGFTFTSASTNAVNGVATINLSAAALNTSGAYSVTVNGAGLTAPPASPVTVTSGPTTKVIASAVPTTLTAGQAVGNVTITTEDQFGNTSAFNGPATVTVTGPSGPSSNVVTYPGTVANGMVTIAATGALNTSGTYSVVATADTFPSPPQTVTVSAGAAMKFVTSVIPTALTAGNNLGTITATIEDALGNTVTTSTAPVTVSITGPAGFTFTPVTVNAASGKASINLSGTPLNTAGSYTVTVTSSGLTGPAATVVTVSAGAATNFTTSAIPTALTAGGNLGTITATIKDAQGNTATASTAPVTVNITGPGGFTSTTTANAAAGLATINLTAIPLNMAGSYTVTVTSAGLTGPAATTVVVSAGAATNFTTSAIPTPLTAGGNLGTITATIKDAQGNTTTSTAPVTVSITGPAGFTFAPVTVNAVAGVAAINLTGTPLNVAGSYTVTVTSTGLTGPAATVVTVSAGAATNFTTSAIPTTLTAGGNLGTITATIKDAQGNTATASTAPVTVSITGPGGFTSTTTANAVAGIASVNTSAVALNTAGTYTVTVASTGLTGPAPAMVIVSAGAATNFTILPIPTAINAGGNLGTITATIKDGLGNTVTTSTAPVLVGITGPGGFTGGGTANAQAGVATINLSGTPLNTAGTYTVTVTSAGLAGPAATNVVVSATVPAAFLLVTGFPTTINAGGTGMVTVTVQDQFHNTILSGFNGTVTLSSSDPAAAFMPPSFTYTNADAGVHTFTVMLNTAGTQSITATTAGATGSETGIVVGKTATTATLTLTPGGIGSGYGIAESLTATIVPATDGTVMASGTVQFKDNGTVIGAPVAVANGKASLNLMFPAPGSHSYTATYSGDANFAGAASNAVTFLVSQAATMTTLTSSGTPSAQGAQVTFTATVVGANGGAPTGTVTFLDGTTVLGTATLGGGGMATFMTTFTTNGPHSITAVYGGDINFTGSTSAAFVQSVTAAFTLSLNPNSLTLHSGENGFVELIVTPQGSFTGLVNLSCSNLPSTMECTFFPATVGLNGGSQIVELVVKTRGSFGPPVAQLQGTGNNNDAPVFPALAFWMPGAALSAFGLRRKNMNGRKRQALLLIVLTLGMGGMLGLAGCGSGDGPKTPTGTYNVTVTGTSGTLVNSAVLTVVIK